jgi:hypothetical protein
MPKLKNYLVFFSKAILLGILSFIFFWLFINPYNIDFKISEAAINTYALNTFVAWTFFSVFLLIRSDEEWKKTYEAVREHNFKKFSIEAPKKIAASVKLIYLTICILVVTSYYLFHFESTVLAFVIIFGTSFIVVLTKNTLWDLDNPLQGLINVPNIPKEWIKKVER